MTNNLPNDQNHNGPRPLEKSVRIVALINIALGIFVFILQFAVDITLLFDLADWVSTGFWGGVCFVSTGAVVLRRRYLLIFRKSARFVMLNTVYRTGGITALAVSSILCGLAMLGVYIWNISTITYWGRCYLNGYSCKYTIVLRHIYQIKDKAGKIICYQLVPLDVTLD